MGLKESVHNMFSLGRRVAENMFDIAMSFMREAASASKYMQVVYDIVREYAPFGLLQDEPDVREPYVGGYPTQTGPAWADKSVYAPPPPPPPAAEEAEVPAASEEPEVAPEPPEEPEAKTEEVAEMSRDELIALTKKELQAKCDTLGLDYRSKDTKAQLADKILGKS